MTARNPIPPTATPPPRRQHAVAGARGERSLHIVYCLSALSLGGSELATVELAEGLCAAGHRVTVVARRGPLAARCEKAGIQLLDWPLGAKRLGSLRYIRRLRHWLRQQAVDVVHAQARLPAWIAYLALRGLPPPQRPLWVTTVHGQYSRGRYSRIMTSGDGVIAVSAAMADWAAVLDPACASRTQVIYGGVATEQFFPAFQPSAEWLRRFDEDWPGLRRQPLLALVARGTRLKNHAGFIRLLAALRQRGHDVAGLLIGGFSTRRAHYRAELEQLAEQLQVRPQLYFLGDRDDVRELMAIAAVVVNISNKAEAFGRTLAEALALGRPVLSWNRGGASEILAACYPAGAVTPEDEAALVQQADQLLREAPPVTAPLPFLLSRTRQQTLAFYRRLLPARAAG